MYVVAVLSANREQGEADHQLGLVLLRVLGLEARRVEQVGPGPVLGAQRLLNLARASGGWTWSGNNDAKAASRTTTRSQRRQVDATSHRPGTHAYR